MALRCINGKKGADNTTIPSPTSSNPTATALVHLTTQLHHRHTRKNSPAIAPTTAPLPHTTLAPQPLPMHALTTQPTPDTPPLRCSDCSALLTPCWYSYFALAMVTHNMPTSMPHCCAIVHLTTGEAITKYKTLQKDPLLHDTWAHAFGKEFGNHAQGDTTTNTPGTDTILVLTHQQIAAIKIDQTVTYTRVDVNY